MSDKSGKVNRPFCPEISLLGVVIFLGVAVWCGGFLSWYRFNQNPGSVIIGDFFDFGFEGDGGLLD